MPWKLFQENRPLYGESFLYVVCISFPFHKWLYFKVKLKWLYIYSFKIWCTIYIINGKYFNISILLCRYWYLCIFIYVWSTLICAAKSECCFTPYWSREDTDIHSTVVNNCTFQDQLLRQVGPELKQRIWPSNDISLRKQRKLKLVGKWNDYWLIFFYTLCVYVRVCVCEYMSACVHAYIYIFVYAWHTFYIRRILCTCFCGVELFSIRLIILPWK